MSNDLIADVGTHLNEPGPAGSGQRRGSRPPLAAGSRGARSLGGAARPSAFGAGTPLHPFADPDDARFAGAACRTMLARHVEPAQLLDSIVVILVAKVMDEVTGDQMFRALPGEPRMSASRFDQLVRAALDRLRGATRPIAWPEIEVPEVVAHQILRDLGSYSVLLTAEQPRGHDSLRALFVGAIGANRTSADPSVLRDPVVAARLWQLVPEDNGSPAIGTVAAIAASALARAVDDDRDVVVDLRDGAEAVGRLPAPAPD